MVKEFPDVPLPAGLERLNRLSAQLADQQNASQRATESIIQAQVDKHRREVDAARAAVRAAEAAGQTVQALQQLVQAQQEASELETERHAQMLRWTRASAVAATAAALLALITIVVSVLLAR